MRQKNKDKHKSLRAGMIIFESDIEIVNRIKNGLSTDFHLLVDRYSDRIYKFLYAKSNNCNDIDDILQETFLKAFLNLNKYNEKYQFSTWLYTIAYREMCRVTSARKNKNHISIELVEPITTIKPEKSTGIWQYAKKLNTVFYTVLWLKYHEELDVKEIAVIMKSSVPMVKINLFRARNQLKKNMDSLNKESMGKRSDEVFLSQSSI
jgi:RNA polymerase sigma-70 factor (ECF subfamily)